MEARTVKEVMDALDVRKHNIVVDSRAGVKDPAYLCTETSKIWLNDAAFPEMFVWHSI